MSGCCGEPRRGCPRAVAWVVFVLLLGCLFTLYHLLGGVFNKVAAVTLIVLIFVAVIYVVAVPWLRQCFCVQSTWCHMEEVAHPLTPELLASATTAADDSEAEAEAGGYRPPPTNKTTRRLYYLDNIKSGLTVVVVLHHTLCTFVGSGWVVGLASYNNPGMQVFGNTVLALNQSYFMCLFFFISAYFTPSSLDRKGVAVFMKDKLKRLGIPFLLYVFVVGPLSDVVAQLLSGQSSTTRYVFGDVGPCWFLAWLLLFNSLYLFIGGDNVTAGRPGLGRMLVAGLLLAPVQFATIFVVGGSFLFMPITIGSLPYDILFFTSGVVAKRNKWLDGVLPWTSTAVAGAMTVTAAALVAGKQALDSMCVEYALASAPPQGACPGKNATTYASTFAPSVALQAVVFGSVVVVIPYAMVSLCQRRCNAPPGRCGNFFSTTAFAVYFLHPLVLNLVTWSWVAVANTANPGMVRFVNQSLISTSEMPLAWVWGGFLYTACLVQLIVWPLAYAMKQLPGMRDIF